jgi:hypothetical protein
MEIDMLNNKHKKRIWIITLSGIFGLLLNLLIFYLFQIAIQNNIATYQEYQSLLAATILDSALPLQDNSNTDVAGNLSSYIKEYFPTSSSVYCIITKNDNVLFYKDENTTSSLVEDDINQYFRNNLSLRDNRKYILSKSEIQLNGDNYALIIATKLNYYLKKTKLLEIRLYCMGFFSLFGAALIVVLIYHLYKLRSEERNNQILKTEIRKNRQLIDLLEDDRNRHFANSEKEFSFYNRSIVEEVIAHMTKEDIEKCIQIDITVENPKMEHFIFITAILSRIKGDNSIASYWEKNSFKVLLLNSNKKEAMDFMNLFINKYKSESEEKVEELKIAASRLKV